MTPAEFRSLALALPDTAEGSHRGHADFRRGRRIFATPGHPDAAHLKPQQNGHAVGHWEGDTFVTDATDFALFSSPGLPGGVPKTPTTHVVARFTPSADGQVLQGHFTAEDPENLAKPYSWDFTWHRSEPGTYAALEPCDPRELANSRY